jgi:hypothetical protein
VHWNSCRGFALQHADTHASLTQTQLYLPLVDRMMEEAMEKNAL